MSASDHQFVMELPFERGIVFQAAVTQIKYQGWKVLDVQPGTLFIEARTAVSGFSWGEIVSVTVHATANARSCRLTIRSRLRMATNILASGNNVTNVNNLATAIISALGPAPSAPLTAECPFCSAPIDSGDRFCHGCGHLLT